MEKIIITGTKGFIGSNLKKELEGKYDIIEINEDIFQNMSWKDEVSKYFWLNIKGVFHVGACSDTLETNVNYMMLVNYEFTKHIMMLCKTKNIPMIYSSSAANYGTNDEHPSNLYGWSKYAAEDYVTSNGGIGLRYFNVYGPGELVDSHMAAVIGLWRAAVKNGTPIKIHGDGKQRRDFTHIDDIVDGLIRIAESDEKHEDAWELGTGKNYSLNEVAGMFAPHPIQYVDDVKGNYRETLRINNDAIERLGWQPTDKLKSYIDEIKLRNNGL